MESKLWILTEAKKEAIVRRENVLKESQGIFNEQWKIDWREIQDRLEQERRYKVRTGEK